MADFTSFPFLDIDTSVEQLTQYAELNHQSTVIDNSSMNIQSCMAFSTDNFFYNQQPPEFPGNLAENFPGIFHSVDRKIMPQAPHHHQSNIASESNESKKRKAIDVSESSTANSSPPVSESATKRRNSSRRGKGVKSSEEKQKPREVVHVRARRGQATDSHSLAERVRRGKINERLKCLQDIVPGCYKTMGMAVMLDEIINYVQSLQNQVEFLSMKLTAASTYYDFNSDTDAIETMQRAKAQQEAKEMDRLMREAYGGGFSCFHSTWSL